MHSFRNSSSLIFFLRAEDRGQCQDLRDQPHFPGSPQISGYHVRLQYCLPLFPELRLRHGACRNYTAYLLVRGSAECVGRASYVSNHYLLYTVFDALLVIMVGLSPQIMDA